MQLSSLTHLEYAGCECTTDAPRTNGDQLIEVVLLMPSITHLTVTGQLSISDHSTGPLKLQQLHFRAGVNLSQLLCYPLKSVQCLVIEDELDCGERVANMAHALAYVAKCPRLRCVPVQIDTFTMVPAWFDVLLDQPVFFLKGQWDKDIVGMCSISLTAPCTLVLDQHTPRFIGTLQGIALQPATKVTSLMVWSGGGTPGVWEQARQYMPQVWQQLAASLPPQLSTIVLAVFDAHETWWLHVAALVNALREHHKDGHTTVYVLTETDGQVPVALEALMMSCPNLVRLANLVQLEDRPRVPAGCCHAYSKQATGWCRLCDDGTLH